MTRAQKTGRLFGSDPGIQSHRPARDPLLGQRTCRRRTPPFARPCRYRAWSANARPAVGAQPRFGRADAGAALARACPDATSASPRVLRATSCPAGRRATADDRAADRPADFLPRMRPACGPPSSLSPLHVTRSAPADSASPRVGSVVPGPAWSNPLPTSATTRSPVRARELGQLRDARLPP